MIYLCIIVVVSGLYLVDRLDKRVEIVAKGKAMDRGRS